MIADNDLSKLREIILRNKEENLSGLLIKISGKLLVNSSEQAYQIGLPQIGRCSLVLIIEIKIISST